MFMKYNYKNQIIMKIRLIAVSVTFFEFLTDSKPCPETMQEYNKRVKFLGDLIQTEKKVIVLKFICYMYIFCKLVIRHVSLNIKYILIS